MVSLQTLQRKSFLHIKSRTNFDFDGHLVGKILNIGVVIFLPFWTPGLPEGVLSNRPCPSIGPSVRPSVFKYLRDGSLDFSETLHEVRG